MKNFNILLLSLLLLTSYIYADEDKIYSFIGVQASSSEYETSSTPTVGLKYGRQSSNIRTSIAYNYGDQSDNEYHSLIMQIDTGILENSFRNIDLKPYIGASFGVMQHNHNTVKDRGYLYGANAGLTYLLSDDIDLDLAYRFMKTSKLENLDKISDVTFSMHYFY